MKDFITTIASIVILMTFLLQFAANQSIYTRVAAAEYTIREFKTESEESRKVNDENIRKLKERTASFLGCEPGEISVSVNEQDFDDGSSTETESNAATKKYFRYSIQMPLKGIIAAAEFLGISDIENQALHTSEGIICIEELSEPAEDADEGGEEEVS